MTSSPISERCHGTAGQLRVGRQVTNRAGVVSLSTWCAMPSYISPFKTPSVPAVARTRNASDSTANYPAPGLGTGLGDGLGAPL